MVEFIFWFSLILIFYTYVGYFIVLWIIYKFKPREKTNDISYYPTVSIIISAFNEEQVIGEKIENCNILDYPKDRLEILIGLDGSTDRTEQIIKEKQNGLIHLYSYHRRRGKASVLNDLVKKAQGEILVFSDANTIYEPDALKKLTRHFNDPEIGGVCGKLVLQDGEDKDGGAEGERLYWFYETKIKYLEGNIKTVLGANGAIYAIRKELYESLPVDKVIMDDFLIPLKVVEKGYKVIYDAEAIGTEYVSDSIWDEYKRKVRIGAANFNALKEIRTLLSPAKGYIALGLWSHKIIRWFIPFLALLLFVSNCFLVGESFYTVTFFIQMGFYVAVLIGGILNSLGKTKSIFTIFFYLFVVNLALMIGFYRFIAKTQKPMWNPVKR